MSSFDQIPVLRLAVCLLQGVTTLDYAGPVELFSFISPSGLKTFSGPFFDKTVLKYTIETTYIAETLEPVIPFSGPRVLPDRTYAAAREEEFDILLVPGGIGAFPGAPVSEPFLEFLRTQAPRARYILSVCTGSWLLAKAGILDGKHATTNKAGFREVEADTQGMNITWVKKARWVVDSYKGVENKLWTSSGVTAGMDLANAFLEHILESKENSEIIRGVVELKEGGEGDDPFAAYWRLEEVKA